MSIDMGKSIVHCGHHHCDHKESPQWSSPPESKSIWWSAQSEINEQFSLELSPNHLSLWLSDFMTYAQNNMLMSFESRFSFKLPFWEISSEVVAVLARKHDKLSGNLLQSLSQPLKLETAFAKSFVHTVHFICFEHIVHTSRPIENGILWSMLGARFLV